MWSLTLLSVKSSSDTTTSDVYHQSGDDGMPLTCGHKYVAHDRMLANQCWHFAVILLLEYSILLQCSYSCSFVVALAAVLICKCSLVWCTSSCEMNVRL